MRLEIKLLSSKFILHAILVTLEGIVWKSFIKFGSLLEKLVLRITRAEKCLRNTKMLLKGIFCPFHIRTNHL